MQDDQQISQSVDNIIASTPDGQTDQTNQTNAGQPGYSIGSNPSSSSTDDAAASDDPISETGGPVIEPTSVPSDDGLVKVDQSTSSASDDLGDIKQQALSQLTPIISELDQSPEEKYRTMMMLIQASDDKSLIKNAFEAANNIEDKKAKAEALLNIVNEINYFSSNQPSSEESDVQETL